MKKRVLLTLITILMTCITVLTLTACNKVEFRVNFVVDGEIYATIDTNGQEIIKLPKNPTKEDYTFDGWYWDNDTWQTPFTANSLLDAPLSSNMNVYCKWKSNKINEEVVKDKITFNTFSVKDETACGKVSNATTTFSFLKEIVEHGNATYRVYKEIACETEINSKTISLNVGDNIVYVLQTVGNDLKLYTVIVRRRPMHEVTFNVNGGTAVSSQMIEEDSFAIIPTNPTRVGYTFKEWDYDFNTPITDKITIDANWEANTNTPYKVKYYLQNLENDNYTLGMTENKTGTSDTMANAEIKTFAHFTYKASLTDSGNINANGSTVLKVYYTRNKYTLSNNNSTTGSITNAGTYKYGKVVTSTATQKLGYDFIGWYNGEELISTASKCTFAISNNVVAKFQLKKEMEIFNFISTTSTCTITGLKDKTISKIIVPDCVTNIRAGVFSGCSKLENMTLPFVGTKADITSSGSDVYQYLFGYIFGTISYTGSYGAEQRYSYYDSGVVHITYSTYYIPTTLKSVTITGGNMLDEAFCGCTSLTSVIIGNSVKSISYSAFWGCASLTSVVISDSVTSIGHFAFEYCRSLTSIVIPDSVTSIGYKAFYGCDNLTIYCEAESQPYNWDRDWNYSNCPVVWGYKG